MQRYRRAARPTKKSIAYYQEKYSVVGEEGEAKEVLKNDYLIEYYLKKKPDTMSDRQYYKALAMVQYIIEVERNIMLSSLRQTATEIFGKGS